MGGEGRRGGRDGVGFGLALGFCAGMARPGNLHLIPDAKISSSHAPPARHVINHKPAAKNNKREFREQNDTRALHCAANARPGAAGGRARYMEPNLGEAIYIHEMKAGVGGWREIR
jgi:hypothetical protein